VELLLRGAAGGIAGLGAWCTAGVLAIVDSAGTPRVAGLLPPVFILIVLLAVGLLLAFRCRTSTLALLTLPIVAILPWLGVWPPALYLWTGPALAIVWALVLIGWLSSETQVLARRSSNSLAHVRWTRWLVAGFALASMVGFAIGVSPLGVTGDEPHYLMISTSVWQDGDFDLANDYRENRQLPFYAGTLEPRHVALSPNGREYSFHGPAVALLTLPGFAIAGVAGVRAMLIVFSAAGVVFLWCAARSLTRSDAAAWAAIVALVWSAPFAAQASAIYPDGAAAAIVSVALGGLLRFEREQQVSVASLGAIGVLLALLPWLHLRLVVVSVAMALGMLWLIRHERAPWPHALIFLTGPVVSAVVLFTNTLATYDTLDPTAVFRQKAAGSLLAAPAGTLGLFVDHEYGLLVYAPVFVLATAGVIALLRAAPVTASAALAAATATLVTAASYVWWGGTGAPARFLVPVLPIAALSLAAWWSRSPRFARLSGLALVILGTVITVALMSAERGYYLANAPDGKHSIFEWANTVVDVASALPSLFRSGEGAADAAVVAAAWMVTAFAMFAAASRLVAKAPERAAPLVAWATIVSISVAASLTWTLRGTQPVTRDRSQLALLQSAGRSWRSVGYLQSAGLTSPGEVLSRLRFGTPDTGSDEVLLHAPRVPAGRYKIETPDGDGATEARYSLELGRGAWPVDAWTAGSEGPQFTLAWPVHSVRVVTHSPDGRSGGAARGNPNREVRLVVLAAFQSADEPTAVRVTGYGPLFVYSLDDVSQMESGGFWLRGGRDSAVVVARRDGTRADVDLEVQAAVPAMLRVWQNDWAVERALRPGVTGVVNVPATDDVSVVRLRVEDTQARQAVWITVVPR
jgi:hypothetical protein